MSADLSESIDLYIATLVHQDGLTRLALTLRVDEHYGRQDDF